jgi:hypothetical protein
MTKNTYIMLAPIRLKEGVGEAALVAASDRFQTTFVRRQQGIARRLLLKSKDGSYADLVFFASKDDADRVVAAEASSQECLEYFTVMEAPDPTLPDMGVLSFEHIKTYE